MIPEKLRNPNHAISHLLEVASSDRKVYQGQENDLDTYSNTFTRNISEKSTHTSLFFLICFTYS